MPPGADRTSGSSNASSAGCGGTGATVICGDACSGPMKGLMRFRAFEQRKSGVLVVTLLDDVVTG
jgi:hypothetical protein